MKSSGALVAKIIDIDRQHIPTARLCSPRAIRSKKSEAWFHELKECIRFISKLSSYLGFRVANTFSFWILILRTTRWRTWFTSFSLYLEVLQDFQNKRQALISFNSLLVSHFVFEPHQGFLRKPLLHLKGFCVAQGRDKLAYLSHLFYEIKELVFERSCHL